MIQTTEVSITYKGDGVQTSFPYPYPYRNSDDIVGYIINDVGYEKRITNNFKYDKVSNIYQYPLAGDPLAAPYSIKLIRETPQQQNADLPGKLPFSLIEKSLDWIIMILQEIGSRCNSLWHIRNDCKLSETNARNSASAAAESEENAANSEDMAKKWAMSPISPDGVVDTNSPTGYTQSAKIWAALSKEYAGLSKFKLPIGYYNSVDEMRKSETAIVGRPCVTLGYYEPNDGGGAVYIIRQKKESDVDDGGSVLFLNNGNAAELLIDGAVNVKQFGAKGDNSADDTTAIQQAIDMARHSVLSNYETYDKAVTTVLLPPGSYKITNTLILPSYITLKTLGTAIINSYVGNFPAISMPLYIDNDPDFGQVNLWHKGVRFDGAEGGLYIVNKSTEGSTDKNIGVSLGDNKATNDAYIIEGTLMKNVFIRDFYVGLQLYGVNLFNCFFHSIHVYGGYTGIKYDSYDGVEHNSGEKIAFFDSIISNQKSECVSTIAVGMYMEFIACHFDMSPIIFKTIGYGTFDVFGGWMEGFNAVTLGGSPNNHVYLSLYSTCLYPEHNDTSPYVFSGTVNVALHNILLIDDRKYSMLAAPTVNLKLVNIYFLNEKDVKIDPHRNRVRDGIGEATLDTNNEAVFDAQHYPYIDSTSNVSLKITSNIPKNDLVSQAIEVSDIKTDPLLLLYFEDSKINVTPNDTLYMGIYMYGSSKISNIELSADCFDATGKKIEKIITDSITIPTDSDNWTFVTGCIKIPASTAYISPYFIIAPSSNATGSIYLASFQLDVI